jgi:hypothetical protein
MEVWTAAHWQFLRQLLSLRQRAQKVITPNDRDTHGTTNEKATGKIWSLPKFIPGIVVQGHDWHLIITTSGGGKTVSWQKKNLGDTSSSKGIYQTIHNLQPQKRST